MIALSPADFVMIGMAMGMALALVLSAYIFWSDKARKDDTRP